MNSIRIEITVTPEGHLKVGGEFGSKIEAVGTLELAKHAILNQNQQPAQQMVPPILLARGSLPPARNGG